MVTTPPSDTINLTTVGPEGVAANSSSRETELPKDLGDTDPQFWREKEREAIMRYVDDVLDEAVDITRERAFRDRAIVYLLGLSGVRGAEVFAEPSDDKRNGITWGDVQLDAGAVRVLGKSREYEYAQLPERAATALERYKTVLDPPTDEWPVFLSAHAPSRYGAVREQLADKGIADDEIESLIECSDIDTALRKHEVVPPALSTNGAPT